MSPKKWNTLSIVLIVLVVWDFIGGGFGMLFHMPGPAPLKDWVLWIASLVIFVLLILYCRRKAAS
jgi:Mg2+ and Co2+ transporter CorA